MKQFFMFELHFKIFHDYVLKIKMKQHITGTVKPEYKAMIPNYKYATTNRQKNKNFD